jgi:hypothetical protein
MTTAGTTIQGGTPFSELQKCENKGKITLAAKITDLAGPRVHLKPQAIVQPPHAYLQQHNAGESA